MFLHDFEKTDSDNVIYRDARMMCEDLIVCIEGEAFDDAIFMWQDLIDYLDNCLVPTEGFLTGFLPLKLSISHLGLRV